MVRLEAEVKQITHAIRMAAYNAETTLARALDGHYARAGDEAYALIREALTVSGDIIPGHGELLIRLDPLTAPRRTLAGRPLRPAQPDPGLPPRHRSRPALRGQTPSWHCMKYPSMSGVLITRETVIRGLAGTITFTPAAITVALEPPGEPRVARALALLIDEINHTPPAIPGDNRPITYRITPKPGI